MATLSPRGYEKPYPPVGGIQDELPIGAGMLDPSQQHPSAQYAASPPSAATPKRTFTFTRKTVIIITVVVLIVIGGLVGGLVGGLRNKNSGDSSAPDSQSSGASTTPAQTSGGGISGNTSNRGGSSAISSSSSGASTTSSTRATTTTSDSAGSNTALPDSYPTTATYTLISGGNGVTGISPSPFPGFDEPISSSSLLQNGDFKSGNLNGWTNEDGCWSATLDPSSSSPLQKSTTNNDYIARNNADDLSGGKSCNLTQIVKSVPAGTVELTFLWGNYEWDENTWFYASAGPVNSPILLLAMQDVPRFDRITEWSKAAYSIDFEGGDFVVTFSAHSKISVNDIAQVQLIRK